MSTYRDVKAQIAKLEKQPAKASVGKATAKKPKAKAAATPAPNV